MYYSEANAGTSERPRLKLNFQESARDFDVSVHKIGRHALSRQHTRLKICKKDRVDKLIPGLNLVLTI